MYTYIYVYVKPIYMGRHTYVCLLHGAAVGKRSAFQCRRRKFYPWVGKVPWSRKWQPTPVLLLENSMDRGAWQAIVHGVPKSQTQLSMSMHACIYICIYPFFFTYRLLQKLSTVPCAIQLPILHTALCIC